MNRRPMADIMLDGMDDWLRRPMRLHKHGVLFDLRGGRVGGIVASGMPYVHVWDGNRWTAPTFQPRTLHDGCIAFPGRSDTKLSFDTILGGDGRAVRLRSAGVLDRGVYRALWHPGPIRATPFQLAQDIGPFEWAMTFSERGAKETIAIPEAPNLPGGDALAFQYEVARMRPPELCPCKPWWEDASGRVGDVAKTRWPGGRIEFISLNTLERMRFPLVIDPETATQAFQCSPFCQAVVYANSHACTPPGSAFPFVVSTPYLVGQFHTVDEPSFYGTDRALGGWPSSVDCGAITAASVKMACYQTGGGGVSDDIYFKRAEADGHTCGAGDALTLFQSVDVLGTTKVGDMGELRTTGCSTVTPTYAPYYALNADDIAHLNAFFGFGNSMGKPLYYGLQSKDDNDETAPPWALADAKFIRLWPAVMLKFEALGCGGYIWLVGG